MTPLQIVELDARAAWMRYREAGRMRDEYQAGDPLSQRLALLHEGRAIELRLRVRRLLDIRRAIKAAA